VGIVVHGPRDRPRLALTFDDGPGGGTERALELLAAHRARATFFFTGKEVVGDTALALQALDGGHEVGSHSMVHLDHDQCEREQAVADMLDGAATIERALGIEPRFYRAPYGHFVPGTLAEAGKRGWRCVSWSVSGEDWREGETGKSIAERVLPDLVPGAIVLLHDARHGQQASCTPMLEALEMLLEETARRSLEPVTVSELLGSD
jgi:peptidoglycan/xylan/chitin deacetylase (PgdA/CDA1 family)